MSKTEIFKSYLDFSLREDKRTNGVSEEFAANNPEFEDENKANEACWNCMDCIDCTACTGCTACTACAGCMGCVGCIGCIGCTGCVGCAYRTDCVGAVHKNIPRVELIKQVIYG